jgi:hypothetical protein
MNTKGFGIKDRIVPVSSRQLAEADQIDLFVNGVIYA